MRQSMKVGFVVLLLIGVLGVLQPAWSQEVTAAIVGTVTDPSGAPIKDADVTVTDTERGVVAGTKTNDSGAYNITRLPPRYLQRKVTAPGFQTSCAPAAFTLELESDGPRRRANESGASQRDGGGHRRRAGSADGHERK